MYKLEHLIRKVIKKSLAFDEGQFAEAYINEDKITLISNKLLLNTIAEQFNPPLEVGSQIHDPYKFKLTLSKSHIESLITQFKIKDYKAKDVFQQFQSGGNRRSLLAPINLMILKPRFSIDDFREAYKAQYASECVFFRNPFSRMKRYLNNQRITPEFVKQYARLNPSSRTAKVLKQLKYSLKEIQELEMPDMIGPL